MIKGSYLAFNGYFLPKKNLSKTQIDDIKKHLTVVPKNTEYSGKGEDSIKYTVYQETKDYYIVPRYFGLDVFKQPEYSLFDGLIANINFTGTLRDYQEVIVKKCLTEIKKNGGGLLSIPCGMGKCLSKGTLVMMFDGSLKKVEDIGIGEKIMGNDSTPRTILSLARGREEMFDIIPSKGEKYTVNKSHILSLKNGAKEHFTINGTRYYKEDIIDISVEDYLKLPKMYNNSRGSPLRGYRVPINFPVKDVEIDPYFLGLWLGDGTSAKPQITSIDDEIIDYCKKYTEAQGLNFHLVTGDNISYTFVRKVGGPVTNPIIVEFRKLNLIKNKHVPDIYKYNSEEVRLKILAGLIDTDGSLTVDKTGFEIIQKNERLIDDIVYVARSLGFSCYKTECIKKCTNSPNPDHQGLYYKMNIYGDCDKIPTLLPRKKARPRKQIKNVLNYGITVKSVGIGDYYGFEIDGNKRFVLGDFSVTHNTSIAIYLASVLGMKTLVLTHKSFLQDQWVDRIKQFTKSEVGTIRQKKVDVKGKDFVIGMIQSISSREYDDNIFKEFGCVVIDEAHHYSSRCLANALFKCGAKYTIGLSATPYRSDGLMRVTNWFLGDIMYQIKLKINNQVMTKIITFMSDDELFQEIKVPRKTQKNGRWVTEMKPDYVQMLTNLTKLKQRNDMIISIIDQLRKDPDRKILILSDRIEHLKVLKAGVDKKIQESIDNKEILADEIKTYFYIGDLKRTQREEAESEADILFGSYGLAKEGLDIDRLNTIILATPQKDVVQSVGRILRKVLQTGDVRPLIIDITDKLSMFPSQLKAREDFYKKSKYMQQYYFTQNGQLISPSKYMELLGTPNDRVSKNVPNDIQELLYVPLCEITENDNKENKIDAESSDSVSDSDDEKPKRIAKKKQTSNPKTPKVSAKNSLFGDPDEQDSNSDSINEDERPKKIIKKKTAKKVAKKQDSGDEQSKKVTKSKVSAKNALFGNQDLSGSESDTEDEKPKKLSKPTKKKKEIIVEASVIPTTKSTKGDWF